MKNVEPDSYMIEYAMSHGFSRTCPSNYVYSETQILPLIKLGYLNLAEKKVNECANPQENWTDYRYEPTPEGMKWWFAERVRMAEESNAKTSELGSHYADWMKPVDPANLLEQADGKGIGSLITFPLGGFNASVFAALLAGYFEFVSHRDYSGCARGPSEYITVRLTERGMRFFDSVPRLLLECA